MVVKWISWFLLFFCLNLSVLSVSQNIIRVNIKKLQMELYSHQINCRYMLQTLGICEIGSFSHQGTYAPSVPLTLCIGKCTYTYFHLQTCLVQSTSSPTWTAAIIVKAGTLCSLLCPPVLWSFLIHILN